MVLVKPAAPRATFARGAGLGTWRQRLLERQKSAVTQLSHACRDRQAPTHRLAGRRSARCRAEIARILFRIGRRVVVVDGSLGDSDQGTTAQLGLRDSNRSNLLIGVHYTSWLNLLITSWLNPLIGKNNRNNLA
jgi:hypothetical protein